MYNVFYLVILIAGAWDGGSFGFAPTFETAAQCNVARAEVLNDAAVHKFQTTSATCVAGVQVVR